MRWRGKLLHFVNRPIAGLGVEVIPLSRDFDNHFVAPAQLQRLVRAMADRVTLFLERESIFPKVVEVDVESEVRRFYQAYLGSHYRITQGGSHFANLFWLYILRRTLGAKLVIDSGTFTGASAWSLSFGEAAPQVYSFDIGLALLSRREPNVTYHEMDWTASQLPLVDRETSLCYFDDHIDQIRRVIEAAERGFKYLIFDDDVAVTAIPGRAKDAYTLPKISFLEEDLTDGEDIIWRHRGRERRFRVDRSHLERGRQLIDRMQWVPDMNDITGIHQPRLRLVTLR
jgi:hypothetical protein